MTRISFEDLFHDPVYLEFKNHLYNYRLRRRAIRANTDLTSGPILEVGSGVSPILPPLANVFHTDISIAAIRLLLKNGGTRGGLAVDAAFIPIAGASIGTLVCSEVLEHIPDDMLAIAEFARVLRPGGRLVITVPTHQYFFSSDDRAVGHYRRYDVPQLLRALEKFGFGDFHSEIVTGLADKIGMVAATAVFQRTSSGRVGRPSSGEGSRMRPLLPIYKWMNSIYGGLAWLESRIIPMPLATIVLVRAKRS